MAGGHGLGHAHGPPPGHARGREQPFDGGMTYDFSVAPHGAEGPAVRDPDGGAHDVRTGPPAARDNQSQASTSAGAGAPAVAELTERVGKKRRRRGGSGRSEAGPGTGAKRACVDIKWNDMTEEMLKKYGNPTPPAPPSRREPSSQAEQYQRMGNNCLVSQWRHAVYKL